MSTLLYIFDTGTCLADFRSLTLSTVALHLKINLILSYQVYSKVVSDINEIAM